MKKTSDQHDYFAKHACHCHFCTIWIAVAAMMCVFPFTKSCLNYIWARASEGLNVGYSCLPMGRDGQLLPIDFSYWLIFPRSKWLGIENEGCTYKMVLQLHVIFDNFNSKKIGTARCCIVDFSLWFLKIYLIFNLSALTKNLTHRPTHLIFTHVSSR